MTEKMWVTPDWHRLETYDTKLVALVYEAALLCAYDIEWQDDPLLWCLDIFCSQFEWQELIKGRCNSSAQAGGAQ